MAKIAHAFILLILLMSPATIVNVFAQVTYTVGVKVGDWAAYTFSIQWSSTNSDVPTPAAVEHAEKIANYTDQVVGIWQKTITVNEIIFYKNGSKITSIYEGDIQSGWGNLTLQIIAANLTAGDLISEAADAPTINSTGISPRSYGGASRTVSKLIIDLEPGIYNLTLGEFYWDQKTGFLCEMNILSHVSFLKDTLFGDYNTTTLTSWRMFATNLWQPGPNILVIILMGLGGAIAVAVACGGIYYLVWKPRKMKARRRQRKSSKLRFSNGWQKRRLIRL